MLLSATVQPAPLALLGCSRAAGLGLGDGGETLWKPFLAQTCCGALHFWSELVTVDCIDKSMSFPRPHPPGILTTESEQSKILYRLPAFLPAPRLRDMLLFILHKLPGLFPELLLLFLQRRNFRLGLCWGILTPWKETWGTGCARSWGGVSQKLGLREANCSPAALAAGWEKGACSSLEFAVQGRPWGTKLSGKKRLE